MRGSSSANSSFRSLSSRACVVRRRASSVCKARRFSSSSACCSSAWCSRSALRRRSSISSSCASFIFIFRSSSSLCLSHSRSLSSSSSSTFRFIRTASSSARARLWRRRVSSCAASAWVACTRCSASARRASAALAACSSDVCDREAGGSGCCGGGGGGGGGDGGRKLGGTLPWTRESAKDVVGAGTPMRRERSTGAFGGAASGRMNPWKALGSGLAGAGLPSPFAAASTRCFASHSSSSRSARLRASAAELPRVVREGVLPVVLSVFVSLLVGERRADVLSGRGDSTRGSEDCVCSVLRSLCSSFRSVSCFGGREGVGVSVTAEAVCASLAVDMFDTPPDLLSHHTRCPMKYRDC
eukprot:Sspe_Gene.83920::Locus_55065_Transcript_1_1_Confidence_1.000_Length_1708::g.83920::m.83920